MYTQHENVETMRVSGIPIEDFTDYGLNDLIDYHLDAYEAIDEKIARLLIRQRGETRTLVYLARERNSRRA